MFRPRTVALTAALLFLFTPGTRADVPTPGFRQVTPQLRFDSLDDYPDYRFYLQSRRAPGNPFAAPLQTIEVPPGQPVTLPGEGKRIADLVLLAVPCKEAEYVTLRDGTLSTANAEGTLRSQGLSKPAEDFSPWRVFLVASPQTRGGLPWTP
jgi:hypothetical protein